MDVNAVAHKIEKRVAKYASAERAKTACAILALPSLRAQLTIFFNDNPLLAEIMAPYVVERSVEVVRSPGRFSTLCKVREDALQFFRFLRDNAEYAGDVHVRRWHDLCADLLSDEAMVCMALDCIEAFVDKNPLAEQGLHMAMDYARSECDRFGCGARADPSRAA